MPATLNPQAERAQASLIEKLPTAFFILAKHDAPIAIALHAQVDLIEDGCFKEALTLNKAIATRLELLSLAQHD